jgi:hypothetical protein
VDGTTGAVRRVEAPVRTVAARAASVPTGATIAAVDRGARVGRQAVVVATRGEAPVRSGVRLGAPADATVGMARGVGERPVGSGVDPGTSVAVLVTTVVTGPAMSVAALAMSVAALAMIGAALAMIGAALATTVVAATVTGTAAVIAAARRPRASGFAEAPPGCPRRRPVVRSRPSGRA